MPGTATLCTPFAATVTVLSRNFCADFGRPLTKKVMSSSRDGPGVAALLQTNVVVWSPFFRYPSLKSPRGNPDRPITDSPVGRFQ